MLVPWRVDFCSDSVYQELFFVHYMTPDVPFRPKSLLWLLHRIPLTHRIHETGIFTYLHLIDFYGKWCEPSF